MANKPANFATGSACVFFLIGSTKKLDDLKASKKQLDQKWPQ